MGSCYPPLTPTDSEGEESGGETAAEFVRDNQCVLCHREELLSTATEVCLSKIVASVFYINGVIWCCCYRCERLAHWTCVTESATETEPTDPFVCNVSRPTCIIIKYANSMLTKQGSPISHSNIIVTSCCTSPCVCQATLP